MNLFGKKKTEAPPPQPAAPQQTNPSDTINKLRDALETCEKREEHLIRKVDDEIKKAKAHSAANKKREALQCLKRKKLYEQQINNLDGQKNNLTAQMLALEQMNVTREVLDAQRSAAQGMKKMTQEFGGTEGVEKLQEDIEDTMADAAEVQETMSRSMDVPGVDGMDDDDLLAELEGLEQEELTNELSKVELGAPTAMPDAPKSQPLPSAPTSAVTAEEEDELAALERSMAM